MTAPSPVNVRAMTRTFRPYTLDQRLLLPPDLREWLPDNDLAWFLSDTVDELDLSRIMGSYDYGDGRGQPPYHPAMMVKLLLYGYCIGLPSSRKIEQATYRDVAFRVLAADQHPDHDSLAAFRKRHLNALAGLFVQVLRLCQAAGLVKLGHVTLDVTMEQSGAGILVGRQVKTGDNSGVVLLIAGRVDGDVKAVFGPAAGIAFGAAFALVFVFLSWLRRRWS